MKKFIIVIAIVLACALAFAGFLFIDNQRIAVTEYTYASEKIKENFDGFKICVITDFHNGDNYEKIIEKAKAANPDIICVVGDLIGMRDTDFSNAHNLMQGLCDITDVYYTYGNHEHWSKPVDVKDPAIKAALSDLPIKFLNDEVKTIDRGGQKINLIGYGDEFYDDLSSDKFEKHAEKRLKELHKNLDSTVLPILLMHRPQYVSLANKLGYELVLSGHLHGGYVNIPIIQSKILMKHFNTDKYVKGEYHEGNATMFISSGTAREKNMPRIFNTPEIMIVELKSK